MQKLQNEKNKRRFSDSPKINKAKCLISVKCDTVLTRACMKSISFFILAPR
jgi:hypothetical protein